MNKRTSNWNDLLGDIMEAMTRALYTGKHVLVHCQHGLHRTGSLITFWLVLGVVSQELVHDSDAWREKLSESWQTWSRGRQLRQAKRDDRRERDYEGESWEAVMSFFRDMPLHVVQDMADRWKRTAQAASRNPHHSQGSQRSEHSVQSRLPLQGPTVTSVSRAFCSSAAASSAAPDPKQMAPKAKAPAVPRALIAKALDEKEKRLQHPSPAVVPKGSVAKEFPVSKPMPSKEKAPSASPPPPSKSVRGQKRSVPSGQSEPLPQPPSRAKAEQRYGPDWVAGAEWQDGDWQCRLCGNHNWRQWRLCGICKAPRDADLRIGADWYCKCGNFNLARRQVCNRSHCQRPRQGNEQSP